MSELQNKSQSIHHQKQNLHLSLGDDVRLSKTTMDILIFHQKKLIILSNPNQ